MIVVDEPGELDSKVEMLCIKVSIMVELGYEITASGRTLNENDINCKVYVRVMRRDADGANVVDVDVPVRHGLAQEVLNKFYVAWVKRRFVKAPK